MFQSTPSGQMDLGEPPEILTLKYFKPGIEILFPSRDVIETTNFVVDRDAARLFYEVNLYYAAFGQEFNRGTAEIARLMQSR